MRFLLLENTIFDRFIVNWLLISSSITALIAGLSGDLSMAIDSNINVWIIASLSEARKELFKDK